MSFHIIPHVALHLDPENGLCNGTYIVLEVRTMVLMWRILGGNHTGKVIVIPKISLESSSKSLYCC